MARILSILIIEDDKNLARATTRMLRRAFDGAIITDVDNVKGAIALLAGVRFDLVVSDYDIIGGTGGDVLAWLRERNHPSVGSFVFLSGNDACAKEHDKFIEKGTWPDEILAEILRYFPHLDNAEAAS